MKQLSEVAEIDLPCNKVRRLGVEALRDDELLAIVLRNGYGNGLEIAERILRKHTTSDLIGLSHDDLCKIKGMTRAKADVLSALFEFAKRGLKQGLGIAPSITRPADAVALLTDIKEAKKEHFIAMFLNARAQLICRETVSVGSLNASLVHPREVFAPAIGSSAASVILAHNHPSSDVTPSREDIDLTRRMVQAGEIMGIEVLDHLIIGADRFLSMKESNLFCKDAPWSGMSELDAMGGLYSVVGFP